VTTRHMDTVTTQHIETVTTQDMGTVTMGYTVTSPCLGLVITRYRACVTVMGHSDTAFTGSGSTNGNSARGQLCSCEVSRLCIGMGSMQPSGCKAGGMESKKHFLADLYMVMANCRKRKRKSTKQKDTTPQAYSPFAHSFNLPGAVVP